MEKQLFSWEDWDGDQEFMTFYNPVLKVQIGKHPVGTKFDNATILYEKGILQLSNNGPMVNGHAPIAEVYEYNLSLTVGSSINEA